VGAEVGVVESQPVAGEVPSLEELREAVYRGRPLDPHGLAKVITVYSYGRKCLEFRVLFRSTMRATYCLTLGGLEGVLEKLKTMKTSYKKRLSWHGLEGLIADLDIRGVTPGELLELVERVEETVVPWLSKLKIACVDRARVGSWRISENAVRLGQSYLAVDLNARTVKVWTPAYSGYDEVTFWFGWPCNREATAKELAQVLARWDPEKQVGEETIETLARLAAEDIDALAGFLATIAR